ncbi:MAG: cell division protein FtsK [Actinomycetota bacterium]|nr:cell division protein FtsK [Actinomycetota bacterium]
MNTPDAPLSTADIPGAAHHDPDRTPAQDHPMTTHQSGAELQPAPEVLEGELLDPDYTQRPLPVVLPPWLRSRRTALATLRWAVRYAARQLGFHVVRAPGYALGLALWMLRGAGRAIAAAFGWVSARGEYRPLITAARETKRWDQVRELVTERRALARVRITITAWLTLSAAAVGAAGLLTLGKAFGWWVALAAGLGAVWLGRPRTAPLLPPGPVLPVALELSADMLTAALRAAGLVKADAVPQMVTPPLRDGNGWAVTLDLPRGGGKTAADAIAKRDTVAAELGVDEIQVIMSRVRAVAGGHAGRLMIWVADDDPYIGDPHPSPLTRLEQFSVWDPIPFGRDARGRRIMLALIWQSMFFGGLPRRGKTFAQRLPSAAGVLDPYVRHYVADGKGGADWRPMRGVAHRLVIGAEDDAITAFGAMLDELITEMGRRFALLGGLPTSVCPEGKLTPEISRRYDLPVIFITIDELQEYLSAMTAAVREEAVDKLARLARRAPAAGFILNAASQRPDTDSVPAKLREIISYRYCTQVVDRTSSDMVLGKGKAAQGADASILSEDHKGVGVLVTGPGSFEIIRCDYMDLPTFATLCAHGRVLRIAAGTLTGDAATDAVAAAEAAGVQIPAVLADVLYAMHGVERMHTTTLLARLVNADEDAYAEFTPERLADELERVGVRRSGRQVKVDGVNLAGYRRADLEAAVPAGATLPPPSPAQPVTESDQ